MSATRDHVRPLRSTIGGPRRAPAALVALALALSGAIGIGGPAAAAGPSLVIDDFVAPTPANRSVALSNTSLAEVGSGTRVAIGGGGGSMHYAEFTWTFSPPIDLTQGGSLTQMQLDYSNATGMDSAGQPLGNPIMMALYVNDSSGGSRYRGGTGVIPGSGKFVTNFTKQGDDDYRYLEGTGSLTSVSEMKLFVGTSGNYDTAAITVEWLAAVAAESAYTVPSFTGPTTLDLQKGAPLSGASIAVAGYPRPTVTTSGSLPPGVTATTTGTTVTLSGAPTTVGEWDFTVHAYTLDWLTGSRTVHIRSFVAPTVTTTGTETTVLRPQVAVPFSQTLTVSGEPLPDTATFSPALPAGLTGTITGTTLTIAGTAIGPGGPVPTTVTVDNGYATASLALDLAVTTPATLPALDDVRTVVGAPIAPITIAGGGYPAPTLSVSGLPTGLSATATAGGTQITGTPTAAGASVVTVTATNGIGTPASDAFSLVVGTAPTLDVDAATPAPVGALLRAPIRVTGYPAPVVTAAGLPAGLTVSEGADGWAIRGTPTGPDLGPATVTLTATNGLGADATATTVLTVMGAPTISGPTTLDLPRGAPLPAGVTFTGTGYPLPVMTLADGQTLPPGLTMTDDDGVLTLSGTPTAHGVWNLTVVATNVRGTSTRAVRVTVGSAPAFAEPEQTIAVRAGARMDVPLVVTSSPAHTLTIVGGALPPGVRLAADGSLEGYTSWGVGGRYTAQVEARNTFGVDTLSLTIDLLTRPEMAGWDTPELVGNAGVPMSAEFTTEGWTPPTVTLLDPLPEGLVLTQDESDPHTWRVTGTATREARGYYPIRVSLDNGHGSPVVTYIHVLINAELRWILPTARTVVVERGVPITPIPIHLTGYPVPGSFITPGGTGLSIDRATWTQTEFVGTIHGTPPTSGRYWMCFARGTSCTGPTLSLTFVIQDRPVITAEAAVIAPVGAPVTIPITVTGSPAASLTWAGVPAGLRVDPTGTGIWTITGTPDRTVLGEHTITLTASNGLTRTATIALTVTGPPEVAGPVTVTAPLGVSLSGTTVTTTGYPVPVMTLVGELPPGLTMTDDDGVLTLSGTPTEHGAWELTIVATNNEGTATHDVVVTVGSAPVFSEDSVAHGVHADAMLTTQLTASSWPGHTVAIASGALPPGMTLTADGRLFGSAGTAAAGRYELTVQATNAFGSDTLSLTIDVLTRPDIPDGLPALTMTATAGTPVTYSFATSGWDPPTVTALDPLPDWVTLTQSADHTWQITGTPTRDERGSRIVRLELTNDYGAAVTRYLSIAVAATPVWDQPSGRTIIVERGVPIDPVRISSTGYELYGLLPSSTAGLRFTSDSWTSTTATGWIIGTPTGSGSFSACIVDRSLRCYGPTLVTWFTVQDRPVITAPATRTELSDTVIDIPVTVSGTPVSAVTAAGLPTGLTLVAGAAPGEWHITGTVGRDAFRTYDVTLTADNGLRRTHRLTLTVGGVPALDDATVRTDLGTAPDAVLRATGSPRPTLAVTGGALPPGLTTVAVDGSGSLAFTGTPTSPGRWDVTVTATNTHGTDSATVTIEVRSAPVFADAGIEHTLREGDPVDFTAPATGYPAHTVEIVDGVLPAGVTLAPGGRITGTPSVGSADAGSGRYELVLRAWNPEGEDTIPVTLVVLSRPSFPAGLRTMSIDADTAASYTFTTGGWDRPTVTLADPVVDPLPDGLTLSQVDETTWQITGTVARALRGTYEVDLALDNAFGRVVRTLQIDVNAPLVWDEVPASLVVETNRPITPLTLSATGYRMPDNYWLTEYPTWLHYADPDIHWGLTDFSVPFYGVPTTAGPFRLTLTPFTPGPAITVTFLVTDRPVITAPASMTTTAGAPTTIDVTVAGSPVSELTATGLPAGLTLEDGATAGTWTIAGTPLRTALGDHTVTLTADNGLTSVATVHVRVDAQPQFRAGTEALVATVGEPTSRTILVSGAPEATLAVTGLPAGLTLTRTDVDTWTLTGTPTSGSGGRYTARITAENGILDAVTADVEITVREPVTTVHAASGALRVGVPTTIDVTTQGGWPTAATLVVDGALPDGLRFVDDGDGTGRVVGTPAAGTAGRWSVTLVADNGVAPTRVSMVLTVAAAPVTAPAGASVPGTGDGTPDGAVGGSDTGTDTTGSGDDEAGGSGSAGSDGDDGSDEAVADGPEVTVTVTGNRPGPWWWAWLSLLLAAVATGVYVSRRMQKA